MLSERSERHNFTSSHSTDVWEILPALPRVMDHTFRCQAVLPVPVTGKAIYVSTAAAAFEREDYKVGVSGKTSQDNEAILLCG